MRVSSRLLAFLSASAMVAYAVAAPVPSGFDFALQWGLDNTGQVIEGVAGTPGADIDLLDAWNIYSGGSNVTIAIVGTGVNPHGEFTSRLLTGFVATGVGGDPFSTRDFGQRGTREAGIAAASADDDSGIVGVNPLARILPVRVTHVTATTPEYVAEGMIWAVDHGADVVAVPLRFSAPSTALEDAVAYAADHDVVCVAPTGNTQALGVAFPARYDGCVAVASTTNTDQLASFSNFGDEVELSAPGFKIWSTMDSGGFGFEPTPGGQSATALVAGVVSLVRSYAPQLSAVQVRDILVNSADDLGAPGWDMFFGAGRVNARRALEQTPAPALRFSWEAGIPSTILPNRVTHAIVTIANEAEMLVPDSPELHFRVVPGGDETSSPLNDLGNGRYAISFPAISCKTQIEFYITATGKGGTVVTDPPHTPLRVHRAVAVATDVLFDDDFETDLGWKSEVAGAFTTGAWERVDPVGTFSSTVAVQPEYDASYNEKTMCAVTGQHVAGNGVGWNDVDGGPVTLTSPPIALSTGEAEVSFWCWVFSQSGNTDALTVEVSRDGGVSWFVAKEISATNGWESHRFRLSDVPQALGNELRLRFVIGDLDNDSLTEAAVDEVHVESIRCNETPGDVDENGSINLQDFRTFIGCMSGPNQVVLNPPCVFLDLSDGESVDMRDLATFLARFSP